VWQIPSKHPSPGFRTKNQKNSKIFCLSLTV
jgi:hypothetical protein